MAADHPTGTKWIWNVFWLLLIVTAVEVALGLIKPDFMEAKLFTMKLLNWTFIILTLVKAYYIVMYFMHLKYERKNMKMAIALPALILIPYLIFIVLVEAGYVHDVLIMS